jgi:hypothetical protein
MKRMIWLGILSAILGIIAAQVLFSVALAQETATLKGSPLIPPPQYDHPFTGVVTVERIAGRVNMDRICQTPRAIGCALRYTVGGCHLYILDDYGLEHQLISTITYLQIYRHEIGHCNGWPGNHPMHERDLPEAALAVPINELTEFELRFGKWR